MAYQRRWKILPLTATYVERPLSYRLCRQFQSKRRPTCTNKSGEALKTRVKCAQVFGGARTLCACPSYPPAYTTTHPQPSIRPVCGRPRTVWNILDLAVGIPLPSFPSLIRPSDDQVRYWRSPRSESRISSELNCEKSSSTPHRKTHSAPTSRQINTAATALANQTNSASISGRRWRPLFKPSTDIVHQEENVSSARSQRGSCT